MAARRLFAALAVVILLGRSAPSEEPAVYRGKTARQWADALGDNDVRARWLATHALGQLGPAAGVAAEPLATMLANADEEEYVRGGAAWTLGRIGPGSASAAKALAVALTSRLGSVRRNAAAALGRLGPASKDAVPALEGLLVDDDPAVRAAAAVALARIAGQLKAFTVLVEMLRGPNARDVCEAVAALGELGPQAEPAAGELAAALAHSDGDVRRLASRSLGSIGPKALPSVKGAFESPVESVRLGTVAAFERIGAAAVPELVAALEDSSPAVRRAAARALGRLRAEAEGAATALLAAASDPDPQVRHEAAEALKRVKGEQRQSKSQGK